MSVNRWSVRECPSGHLESSDTMMLCGRCLQPLGEHFPVVRATAARVGDPATSRKAALAKEPKFKSQRGQALEAIRGRGVSGATAREVEQLTGISGIWKRISELEQGGFVDVRGTTTDPVTKCEVQVYVSRR